MSHFVLEGDLAAKLGAIAEPVEPVDETGRRIGYYQPSAAPAGAPRSPMSRDEIEA